MSIIKVETLHGQIILDTETKIVTSDVPYKSGEWTFNTSDDALTFMDKLEQEIKDIATSLEKKKSQAVTKKTSLYKKLNKALKAGFNKILLYGITGTGKTHTLVSLCESMKLDNKIDDYLLFTMSSGMEDIDLLGKYIKTSSGQTKFIKSELLFYLEKAAKGQKVAIILDEFNRADSKTLNILIPLLDEKEGKVRINNYIYGKTIDIPSENLIFFLSANFGASYTGTHQIDEAIFNRIDVAYHVYYQEEVEETIISTIPDEDKREKVKNFTEFTRELMKQQAIKPFTTRDLKTLVAFCKVGDFNYSTVEPIINKIVKTDSLGLPDEEILEEFKNFFKEGGE